MWDVLLVSVFCFFPSLNRFRLVILPLFCSSYGIICRLCSFCFLYQTAFIYFLFLSICTFRHLWFIVATHYTSHHFTSSSPRPLFYIVSNTSDPHRCTYVCHLPSQFIIILLFPSVSSTLAPKKKRHTTHKKEKHTWSWKTCTVFHTLTMTKTTRKIKSYVFCLPWFLFFLLILLFWI